MNIIPKLSLFIDSQKIKSGLVILGAEPKIEKVKEFPWNEAALPEIFKKIKSQYRMNEARITLGDEISFLTELSIPKDVTNERSFIGLKASEKFPELLEDENWDFKTVGETKTQKQLRVYSIKKELLKMIKSASEASGLLVELIEPAMISERRNSEPMIGVVQKSDIINEVSKGEFSGIPEKKENMENEVSVVKDEGPAIFIKEKKSGNFKKFLIIFGIIVLVGGLTTGGIILSQKSLEKSSEAEEPTPAAEATPTVAVSTTPTQVLTPSPAVSKKDLKINILNGSGIAGLAGKAKTFLESQGYTVANTGNAEAFTYETTEVSIKEDKKAFLGDLLKALSEKYTLSEKNPTLDSQSLYDVVIILGKK